MTTPVTPRPTTNTAPDAIVADPVYGPHGRHLVTEHGRHGIHILWAILEALRVFQGSMERRMVVLIQEHGVVHHTTERIIERQPVTTNNTVVLDEGRWAVIIALIVALVSFVLFWLILNGMVEQPWTQDARYAGVVACVIGVITLAVVPAARRVIR